MKTQFTNATDFVRAVEVSAVSAQPGQWEVQFSSRLLSAKNPQEWQRNFAMSLHTDELRNLRDALNAALGDTPNH